LEYWVADWQRKQLEVYRRNLATDELELVSTLIEGDILQSPYLQGFVCQVSEIFAELD
jgi:Uma2 family endonuclease